MRKINEIRCSTSCLNSAAMNEPLFVLRANDEIAADIVFEWVCRYIAAKRQQPGGPTLKQEMKYKEAMRLVEEMRAWKRENT